jgi:aerobic carbon-monoxide dehydrogenase large subunit
VDQETPHEHHAFEPRVEDDALLRGHGRFVDDAPQDNQAYACFVRSPHAHARMTSIDVAAARGAPGVVAVLTHKELDAAGVGSCSVHPPLAGRNGSKLVMPFRPALARDRVMHGGQPVALVVAESLAAAQDAAELVAVGYEELDAVADLRAALKPGAPQLWPEAPGNIALDWAGPVPDADGGNAREIAAIFASAAHVARVSVVNQRLVVATMEPRGATARYDAAADSYTLRSCSQGVWPQREQLIAVMGLPREKVRIITEDVGGAFGVKTSAYPEYPSLLVAAKLTGRPVAWMATRSESFLSDQQARDTITEAELALDAKGKFLALRVSHSGDMGAFIGIPGANIQTMNFSRCFPGMYAIARIEVGVRCAFTNTVPTGPYRGAGRPEANYALERVVAEAARITGIDPAKLRRRNLIKPKQIPYKTAVGTTYDSGDFEPILDKALALSDYDTFKQRRREAARRGKLRGIGLSCFLEHAGALPTESAAVLFEGDRLVVGLNVGNTGQGHATIYPRLTAEKLGIPANRIGHRHGDTELGLRGNPSVGSRSTMTAGSALYGAIDLMLDKAKPIAAGMLEAADADVAYRAGSFEVVGTDRRVSLFEVAAHAKANGDTLDTKATVDTPQTFPNGCHIAEVEIDPATGATAIVAYTAVDDAGVVLDHTLVSGQLVGALAQGIGQALMERAVYDATNAQLVTGTFMDYAMPRAQDMPPVAEANHNARATTNPLGVKGVGEAGTTGSIAAVMNAIADAIPDGRGNALDMPATPEKIWRACNPAA